MTRKPIFDAIRQARGRGFTQAEVDRVDRTLDSLDIPRPRENGPMVVSQRGLDLIKEFEGLRLTAYPDPGTGGAPWTIGWGATGPDIKRGTVWTRQQADEWFDRHIVRYADEVRRAIDGAATTQAQFDAMVSFHYNTGAIGRATLTKMHKAGNYAGAANEFARWNKAGGRVMPGLTRRRAAEAKLYRSGTP